MVPLTSSPLPPPPPHCVSPAITPCLPEERDGDTDAPVRAPRICRSDARSQSPKWARRPRPAHRRPARSRRDRAPETAGSPNARFARSNSSSSRLLRSGPPCLEEPPQLFQLRRAKRAADLLPKRIVVTAHRVGQVVRYQEADGPSRQRPRQLRVALEEHAEVGSAAAVSQGTETRMC